MDFADVIAGCRGGAVSCHRRVCLWMLLLGLTAGTASAGVWDGGGTNDYWSTPANWVGDTPPSPADDLEFPAVAAKFTSVNDSLGQARSLIFSGSGYSLSGTNLSLALGITANSGVNIIGNQIRLLLPQSFSSVSPDGTLALSGWIDNNGYDLTLNSLGAILLGGPLRGSGGLIKTGSGHVQLGFSSRYTGPTEIREGTLFLVDREALGAPETGTTIMPAGRLVLLPGVGTTEPFNLSGTLELGAGSSACAGPIVLPAGSTAHVEVGIGLLTLSGIISGDGGFSKGGAGTLFLNRDNTYVGPTEVEAGRLQVLGVQPGSAVNVHSGASLIGTGTVGALTCAGTLSPGVDVPGILRVSAGALFTGSSIYEVQLNGATPGSQYDQLKVNGQVQIENASLKVSGGFVPAMGSSFTVIDNDGSDPVVGTFSGLPEGAVFGANMMVFGDGVALAISYVGGTGNDVVLTRVAVPPPTIVSISLDASRYVTVQGKGISQFNYTFEASSNMVSWAVVGGAHSNDNGDFAFTDTDTQYATQRFYRVGAP